jgi:frataxin-like iron-binding protein CyaY
MQIQYKISISFTTNQKLNSAEIDALCAQIAAQIEEPVTSQGDDVEYETNLLEIEIEEDKKEGSK